MVISDESKIFLNVIFANKQLIQIIT